MSDNKDTDLPSFQEALIYTMVTMSAVDRDMSDQEMRRIGLIVQILPAFVGFDENKLVQTAKDCGKILNDDKGLDKMLQIIADAIPERMYETAYALAVEIAAVDLTIELEEARLLQLIRRKLNIPRLSAAAIERSARARFML